MEYNISIFVTGGDSYELPRKIEELIKQQNGTILSADLDKYGIPRKYLQRLINEGRLERCDRGVYVAVDAIEDEMFAMQKKYSNLIYSHETALLCMIYQIEHHSSIRLRFLVDTRLSQILQTDLRFTM